MNMRLRTLGLAGITAVVLLGFGTSHAQAQSYSVNVSVPGFSMGIGGGFTASSSAIVPGVSVVAPSPVVVGTSYPVYTPYYAPTTYAVPSTYYYTSPSVGYSVGLYVPYRYGIWW